VHLFLASIHLWCALIFGTYFPQDFGVTLFFLLFREFSRSISFLQELFFAIGCAILNFVAMCVSAAMASKFNNVVGGYYELFTACAVCVLASGVTSPKI